MAEAAGIDFATINSRRALGRLSPALACAVVLALAHATPARAVEVVTPYPSLRVEAGQTVSFDLRVISDTRQPVRLQARGVPKRWDVTFRGGGREIGAVYAGPGRGRAAEVEIKVPRKAPPRRFSLTVVASGSSGSDSLPLEVQVTRQAADAYALTGEFRTLRGKASDTFRFDLTLTNNTTQRARFALSARGPRDWNVTASPSAEQKAATVTVDAGGTSTIAVEADPPENVPTGKYELVVEARGAGTTLHSDLLVEIAGTPSFTLNTTDERLNASGSAGDPSSVSLVVQNDGNAPLQGLKFSSTPPSDWKVSFEPEVIDAIPPGESARVTATITPSSDAIAGDYMVTVSASAGSASEELDIRYAVKTSTVWGLLGGVVILGAFVGLVNVYRRFGRR
jgi:uncharacterized membrane protein